MKSTRKERKITVKFFLNQAVEPAIGERKEKFYPLYVQVTYSRKNMQFKSAYSEYYESLDEVKPSLLKFEERVIKSIIGYEAEKVNGDYDLKGLKRKYDVYSVSILEAVEQYLKPKLRASVMRTGDELSLTLNFDSAHATVDRLHKASQLLFKNFDSYLTDKLKEELKAYDYYQKLYRPILTFNFPTVIDWVDGSYKTLLRDKLSNVIKSKPELYSNIIALIDLSVKNKLKLLEV